ncbi:MAG: LamG domain-containing protein, partial [Verrucomicrobiaceae bacterium]
MLLVNAGKRLKLAWSGKVSRHGRCEASRVTPFQPSGSLEPTSPVFFMKSCLIRHCSLLGLLSSLASLSPGTVRAAYPDEILADKPLGYWRLGETGTAPEILPVANLGSAGAEAAGAYTNFVLTGQPGALAAGGNTAAKFTGTGHVNIPWVESINPSGPFTVEAWINTAGPITDFFSPLSSINFSEASRAGWQIYQTPTNQWEFRVGNDQAAAYVATATGGTVTPGTWTHLAAVYDGANIILYINGVAVDTKPLTGPFSPNTATPLGIAARILPTGVDRYLASTMDEVAIYPSALSAAVIASHTANALSAAPAQPYDQLVLASSPTGYWRLGEGPLYRSAANAGSLGADGAGYYLGDPSVAVAGVVPGDANTAVTFDGVDDKIDVLYQPALNPSGAFTYEIWAKSFNGSTHRSPLSSRDDTPVSNTAGYIFYLTPENVWSMWSGAGTGNGWPAVDGPPLIEDEWTHLVGVYDGKKIRFIVNGVQAGSTSVPLFQRNSARPLRIGGGATEGAGTFFWQGELDEAAVYDGALPEARILNHYTTIKGAPEVVEPVITLEPAA